MFGGILLVSFEPESQPATPNVKATTANAKNASRFNMVASLK
jgi:hypothetical protein